MDWYLSIVHIETAIAVDLIEAESAISRGDEALL